jgi:hypothetical protein
MKKTEKQPEMPQILEHSVSSSFMVGSKIPHIKNGYIKIMAFVDGYYMARFKGCVPFVCTQRELIRRMLS